LLEFLIRNISQRKLFYFVRIWTAANKTKTSASTKERLILDCEGVHKYMTIWLENTSLGCLIKNLIFYDFVDKITFQVYLHSVFAENLMSREFLLHFCLVEENLQRNLLAESCSRKNCRLGCRQKPIFRYTLKIGFVPKIRKIKWQIDVSIVIQWEDAISESSVIIEMSKFSRVPPRRDIFCFDNETLSRNLNFH
jgi:hypothetical protein